MTEIPAGEFKTRCLQLLDQVAVERVQLVVTKRGRPVAKVVPLDEPASLLGSVTVLAEHEDDWFSTADLVEAPGGLPG